MLGLDAAGKTSLLYRMKLGEVVATIPTIGFYVETVTHKNITLTCWDVGGRTKVRALYRHYISGAEAFIFVVDSIDRDRIEIARDELRQAFDLEDDDQNAAMLVLANKQDLPRAMSISEMTDKLQLNSIRDRPWYIQGCSATTGDGVFEGLDWIASLPPRGVLLKPSTMNKQTALKSPLTMKEKSANALSWNSLGNELARFLNLAL